MNRADAPRTPPARRLSDSMSHPDLPTSVVLVSARAEDHSFAQALSDADPGRCVVRALDPAVTDALDAIRCDGHDAYLVDEGLALEQPRLVTQVIAQGSPLLVLVDDAGTDTDERWIGAGACDCLARPEVTPERIARVLRRARIRQRDARVLENRSAQAQKMEAIGRLAGGVAHDFNNLLTAITGYASILLHEAGDEHPWRQHIEEISKAADRGGALTRQLAVFSRDERIEPRIVDLNAVVHDIHHLLRRLIGEDIAIDARARRPARPGARGPEPDRPRDHEPGHQRA